MGQPYPAIARWSVPLVVLSATLDAVHPSRHPGVETGVFWLGRRHSASTVSAVVMPRGVGVDEQAGGWRVSPEVFGTIGSWATTRGISLLAVCHTHGGPSPAQLSRRDRTHSVKAPGILSVVIGRDGDEPNPGQWGWYVWEHGDYRMLGTEELSHRLHIRAPLAATVWTADVTGVFIA